MNKGLHKLYEADEDEEITQVRQRPAKVVSLRNKIYLVVTDCPEQTIQEFDIDPQGRLLDEVTGSPSDWSFASAGRIGNWNRSSGITSGIDEEVALEDERASKYFTCDFGKAIVRYVEVLEEARNPKEAVDEIRSDDSVPVDTSDIDQLSKDLGLTDEEREFFS